MMRWIRARLLIFAWSLLVLTLFTSSACAEDDASPNARAVELGYAGLKLYEQQRYAEALARFSAAEDLTHSPVFVLYMARSQRKLGHLLAAKALLRELQTEPESANAPAAWQTARRDALLELKALEDTIPTLSVNVRGATSFPLYLRDGERAISIEAASSTIQLDPGDHTLTLRDARGRAINRTVHIPHTHAGSERRPTLTFEFGPKAGEKVHPRRPPTPISEKKPERRDQNWGARAAIGLGSTALVLGGVAGVVALFKANDIKERCVGSSCLASDEEKGDSARRFANLATVGVVVGLVGIGTGVTLLF